MLSVLAALLCMVMAIVVVFSLIFSLYVAFPSTMQKLSDKLDTKLSKLIEQDTMITSGFGTTIDLKTGRMRQWFVSSDGVKRWADTNEPVEHSDINSSAET